MVTSLHDKESYYLVQKLLIAPNLLWTLSQTNSNIGFVIALDLFMTTVNLALFACRRIQPRNSSLSFHVSWLENN